MRDKPLIFLELSGQDGAFYAFLGPKTACFSNFQYSSGALAVCYIFSFGPNNCEKLSDDAWDSAESRHL